MDCKFCELIGRTGQKHHYRCRDLGLYRVWEGIGNRCSTNTKKLVRDYSAKGIKCEWISYEEFKNDMYKKYIKHLKKYGVMQTTIDRIDADKNYCKENCRWATHPQQMSNIKRKPRFCRMCNKKFIPNAPRHYYCGAIFKEIGCAWINKLNITARSKLRHKMYATNK